MANAIYHFSSITISAKKTPMAIKIKKYLVIKGAKKEGGKNYERLSCLLFPVWACSWLQHGFRVNM
jgi:hypothetical protein